MPNEKSCLRSRLRTLRQGLGAIERARRSQDIAQQFFDQWAVFQSPVRVALYAAIGTEADPGLLEPGLRARGCEILYPRVVGDDLCFHAAQLAELSPQAPWGIPEPRAHTPPTPPESIDVFVVPGLGFSRTGARLGYGRGFYDKALRMARSCEAVVAVGYAFDIQVVDVLPEGPHDERVDGVALQDGIWWSSR